MTVTDSAFAHLRTLVQEQGDQSKGLRIFVERGGCAGMQYGMKLDHVKEGDEIFTQDEVRVMVDPESAEHLRGVTIDFSDDLAGSGFRIKNPNAVRSCGCGTSFEAPAAASDEEGGAGAEAHSHSA